LRINPVFYKAILFFPGNDVYLRADLEWRLPAFPPPSNTIFCLNSPHPIPPCFTPEFWSSFLGRIRIRSLSVLRLRPKLPFSSCSAYLCLGGGQSSLDKVGGIFVAAQSQMKFLPSAPRFLLLYSAPPVVVDPDVPRPFYRKSSVRKNLGSRSSNENKPSPSRFDLFPMFSLPYLEVLSVEIVPPFIAFPS